MTRMTMMEHTPTTTATPPLLPILPPSLQFLCAAPLAAQTNNHNRTKNDLLRLNQATIRHKKKKRSRGSAHHAAGAASEAAAAAAATTPRRKRHRAECVVVAAAAATDGMVKQRLDFSLCNGDSVAAAAAAAAADHDDDDDDDHNQKNAAIAQQPIINTNTNQPLPPPPPLLLLPLSEFDLHFDETAFHGGRTKKTKHNKPTNTNQTHHNAERETQKKEEEEDRANDDATEDATDDAADAAACLLRGLKAHRRTFLPAPTTTTTTTTSPMLGSVSSRITWCPAGSLLGLGSTSSTTHTTTTTSTTHTTTAAIHVHTPVFSRSDLMIFQGELVLTTIVYSPLDAATTAAAARPAPDSPPDTPTIGNDHDHHAHDHDYTQDEPASSSCGHSFCYGCTDNGGSGSCAVTIQRRLCCIKLRLPSDISKDEANTTRAIFEHPHAGKLMPQIHAHFETTLPYSSGAAPAGGTRVFHGICMDYIGHTVNLLLFPGRAPASSNEALRIQALYADAVRQQHQQQQQQRCCNEKVAGDDDQEENVLHPPPPPGSSTHINHNNTSRGTPLRLARTASPLHGADLHTALAAACLETLQRLHRAGWVHGDTHLGNFLLDVSTWRVYLIDFERSFRCNVPQQHLLDVQELFGHASGALVSYPYNHSWDMREILPLLTRLHPAFPHAKAHYASPDAFAALHASPPPEANTRSAQRRRLFHLLPVCTCFVHETRSLRLAGCPMCNSQFNRTTANYYYYHYISSGCRTPPTNTTAARSLFFNFEKAVATSSLSTTSTTATITTTTTATTTTTPVAEDTDNQEQDDAEDEPHQQPQQQQMMMSRPATLPQPPALLQHLLLLQNNNNNNTTTSTNAARQTQRFYYYYHPNRFVDALFDVSLPRIASMVQRERTALRLEYVPVGDALVEVLPVLRHLVDFQGVDLKSKDGRAAFDEWFHEMMYGSGVLKGGVQYVMRLATDLDKIGCHDLSRVVARTVTPHYLLHPHPNGRNQRLPAPSTPPPPPTADALSY